MSFLTVSSSLGLPIICKFEEWKRFAQFLVGKPTLPKLHMVVYLCTRRKIKTSFSCLVLLKCYHVVFSQFKFPANLAQLVVPKMHCLYANFVVQPSPCPCYMAWKTKVHTWCRHCHLCIKALMSREERWLQRLFDPPRIAWLIAIARTQCNYKVNKL